MRASWSKGMGSGFEPMVAVVVGDVVGVGEGEGGSVMRAFGDFEELVSASVASRPGRNVCYQRPVVSDLRLKNKRHLQAHKRRCQPYQLEPLPLHDMRSTTWTRPTSISRVKPLHLPTIPFDRGRPTARFGGGSLPVLEPRVSILVSSQDVGLASLKHSKRTQRDESPPPLHESKGQLAPRRPLRAPN